MRERIETLRGTLEIESAPGQGTTVLASIPVRPLDRSPSNAGSATRRVQTVPLVMCPPPDHPGPLLRCHWFVGVATRNSPQRQQEKAQAWTPVKS
jgi:hypothetical protein